jgi:hypothetical protein
MNGAPWAVRKMNDAKTPALANWRSVNVQQHHGGYIRLYSSWMAGALRPHGSRLAQ